MPRNKVSQWGWADVEELLQCPVCLDIPAPGSIVEQCRNGHHICAECKKQLNSCPLCKCTFHGTRNFVVEELTRNFQILKNTMLLNNIAVDIARSKKKAKVKINGITRYSMPKLPPIRKVHTPNCTRGEYPCRVPDCNAMFPASRLLNHVRAEHSNLLTETIVDITDNYNQIWEIPYRTKKPITYTTFIIFVRGIGLVFLNIEILRSGHLTAIVQMGTSYTQAQNFLSSIDIFSEIATLSFSTRVVSVRDTMTSIMEKKACFTLSKNQVLRNICVNRRFNCRLSLSRFNILDTTLLSTPNCELINAALGFRRSLLEQPTHKKFPREVTVPAVATAPVLNDYHNFCEEFQNTLRLYLNDRINNTELPNGNDDQETDNTPSSDVPSTSGRRRNRKKSRKPAAVEV